MVVRTDAGEELKLDPDRVRPLEWGAVPLLGGLVQAAPGEGSMTYATFMSRYMGAEGTQRGNDEGPVSSWNDTEERRFREMISKALRVGGVGDLLALARDVGFGVTRVRVPEGKVHDFFRKDGCYPIWASTETQRQLKRLGRLTPAPDKETACVVYVDERLVPPGNGAWRTCRALVGVHNGVFVKNDPLRVALEIMVRVFDCVLLLGADD